MARQPKTEAERWYKQATFDLKAALWNIEGGFYDTACFLAQQAAEKSLKSLLYYLQVQRSALFTHSIVAMIEVGQEKLPHLGALLNEARELDLHYIPSRYPDSLPSGYPHQIYSKAIADDLLAKAQAIVSFVSRYYEEQGETTILTTEER